MLGALLSRLREPSTMSALAGPLLLGGIADPALINTAGEALALIGGGGAALAGAFLPERSTPSCHRPRRPAARRTRARRDEDAEVADWHAELVELRRRGIITEARARVLRRGQPR